MKLVKITDAKAGDKVGKDVLDLKGNLLLKAGTVLTADMIERIKARMVDSIFIEDAGSQLSAEEIAKKEAEIDQALDEMFKDVAANPLMALLRESARKYLKQHLRA